MPRRAGERALPAQARGEPWLGPSECTVGPTAAAIANAIHDATGLRLTRLPFNSESIRAAALNA